MSAFIKKREGMISLFLTGVLLLTFFASGSLMDLAQLELGKSEAKSSLQLASHSLLSHFDQQLEDEYGLFAAASTEIPREEMDEYLRLRLWGDGEENGFLRYPLENFSVRGEEGARLSRPQILEAQIREFMKVNAPMALLNPILEKLSFFQNIPHLLDVVTSKLDFEEALEACQSGLDNMNQSFDALSIHLQSLPNGKGGMEEEKGHRGLFPGLHSFQHYADLLQNSLAQMTEEQKKGLSEPELAKAFAEHRGLYFTVEKLLKNLVKQADTMNASWQEMTQKMVTAKEKQSSWKKAIDQGKDPDLKLRFSGDYYARANQLRLPDFQTLVEESQKLGRIARDFLSSWKQAQLNGTPLHELRYSQWKEAHDRGKDTIVWGKLASAGNQEYLYSKAALDRQRLLMQQSNKKRSGLWEFIQAWHQRAQAIRRAKGLQSYGVKMLSGDAEEFGLSRDMNRRFVADGAEEKSPGLGPLPGLGSTQELISSFKGYMQNLKEEFRSIPGSLASDRGPLYLYWMGMFSDRSAFISKGKSQERSLLGRSLVNRPLYGGEMEYILFGRNDLEENSKACEHRIAALRFCINLIYAFTSQELHAQTLGPAMALAGWTGFGVPLVQSAFLLLLVAGETYLDMEDLFSNHPLPLLKSASSWRFSLRGVGKLVKRGSANLFDRLEELSDDSGEAFLEELESRFDRTGEAMAEGLLDRLALPILQWSQEELLSGLPREEARKSSFEQFIKELAPQFTSLGDQEGLSALEKLGPSLISQIGDLQQEKKEQGLKTEQVIEKLKSVVRAQMKRWKAMLHQKNMRIVQGWKNQVHKLRGKGEQAIKRGLDSLFQKMKMDLGPQEQLRRQGSGQLFCMDYSSYLRLFLLLHSCTEAGKNGLLSNTARCIQMNLGENDLTLAPTSYQWKLTSSYRPRFWGRLPALFSGNSGKVMIHVSWVEGFGYRGTEGVR